MPFCPSCRTEFREGFTRCSDCGATLVAKLEEADSDQRNAPFVAESEETGAGSDSVAGAGGRGLQVVSDPLDQADAAFLRSLLDAAAIPSVIQQTPAAESSIFGSGSVSSAAGSFQLLVAHDDRRAAVEIIDQSRSPLLAVGQIEEQLRSFQAQLTSMARARPDCTSDLEALGETIEALLSELRGLAERLDAD